MSHKQLILKHLQSGGEISGLLAFRLYGCYRLSARINELRKEGIQIKTILKKFKGGNSEGYHAVYKIESNDTASNNH